MTASGDRRRRKGVRVLACTAALGLTMTFAGTAAAEDPTPSHGHDREAAEQQKQGMGTVPMNDHEFATMMRKHHQDGIDMARNQLKNGKDPKMLSMARKILDVQQKEVAEFDEWLAAQKTPQPAESDKPAP